MEKALYTLRLQIETFSLTNFYSWVSYSTNTPFSKIIMSLEQKNNSFASWSPNS